MAWSYPDISLEDLVHLIKGFVDMLVLASGYRSSGLDASWDADDAKKAIRWGTFLQEVFRHLRSSSNYNESLKELDSAFLEMISSRLPQGLTFLSSRTLANARDIMLEHLFQTLPLKETHLGAILTAVINLDLEDSAEANNSSVDLYIGNLMTKIESLDVLSAKKDFLKNSFSLSLESSNSDTGGSNGSNGTMAPSFVQNVFSVELECVSNSTFIIVELLKRQGAISGKCLAETSMDTLVGTITMNILDGLEFSNTELFGKSVAPRENLDISFLWRHWKVRSLSYLLDKRTIRLLSGAKLIFTAQKEQWFGILESLKVITGHTDNLLEIIELVMLSLASNRWKLLIELLMSSSMDFPTMKQYDMHNFLYQFQVQRFKGEAMDQKESDLMEYVMVLLDSQTDYLWRLSPVLVAAALPLWSMLFKMYLRDLESLLSGAKSSIRCSDCIEGKSDQLCDIAERAWCLHVVHFQDPNYEI